MFLEVFFFFPSFKAKKLIMYASFLQWLLRIHFITVVFGVPYEKLSFSRNLNVSQCFPSTSLKVGQMM